jgi:dienelactone hydrolase
VSPAEVTIPAGYVSDPFECMTPVGSIVRRVLRRSGDGPAIILMHEAPGISASTFEVADRLEHGRFTVVVPELLDAPTGILPTLVRLCIAREMGALTRGEAGGIVTWIRGLAAREAALAGGRHVGVIGMCFSGGFALAAAIDPKVRAVVSSQPALPFALSDLGMSTNELDDLRANVAKGTCVRGLRYRLDFKSPGPRMARLKREVPSADIEVIPTWNPNRHSVLGDAVCAADGSRLALAFKKTMDFLHEALDWPATPSA